MLHCPYIIIPKLIQQSTWGGDYIVKLKNFSNLSFISQYKIGQSYELFSGTKLFLSDTTENKLFIPEIGHPDYEATITKDFPLSPISDYISLSDLIKTNLKQILGPKVVTEYGTMPLLIKVTQALGNSFQLHVKPGSESQRWQPKPESWYYLEDGLLTRGIKKGISIAEYKKACLAIDRYMYELSSKVVNKTLNIADARQLAKSYCQEINPWQFVNFIKANKYNIFDMSIGGLHHSWEEDLENFPLGNIIYEVQHDRMDPISTVRSFDQGKIKDDGTTREITIEDYFQFLDTSEELNSSNVAESKLTTKYYAMDVITITESIKTSTNNSFIHLYVRDGEVTVETDDGSIKIRKGCSCFVPYIAKTIRITSLVPESVVLKTYIP